MTEQEKEKILDYPLKDALLKLNYELDNNNKMCCPFHKEDTPSFSVNVNKNFFYCFGCGKGGNIFNFIQYIKEVSFVESIKIASEITGVPVSEKPLNKAHEEYKNLMTSHAVRYYKNLESEDAKKAIGYLKSRNITLDTIQKFKLGYVPNDEYKHRKDLKEIGGRISFPIFEMSRGSNKVIGLGYRTLKDFLSPLEYDKKKDVKYKNDKTTTDELEGVFQKKEIFYGYNLAIENIRKQKCAVLVEGYMDVISMHQAGIDNTLGIMTSNISENMIDILSKNTNLVWLFTDADEAGQKGAIKCIPPLLEKGIDVRVFVPEGGKDAADMCNKYNFDKDIIKTKIISESIDGMKFLFDKVLSKAQNNIIREQRKALDILNPLLGQLGPYSSERAVYENYLYKSIYLK